ncbi:hypothetical protein [Paenibacillus dendritiformis]|nr:hypothetical protein [Paenibacillus dendritiformis]CAH8773278.1 hypothetical protein H7S4_006056 [Paenibacillus dendritiformis]
MYNAAIKMSSGDFSYNSSNYFRTWTYQLGFTMYQALIIKIFGTSMATLKILNALYCMGITVLVYQISSTLFGDIAAKFSSVIYCFYIPSIVMSSVLTNQHLGTFLFYLAFYYFLRNPTLNVKKTILCAVLISMGNIVRPLGSLVLVCILFYSLLFLLLNKRTIRKTFRFICVFMVSYFAIFYLVSFFAIGTGISSSHLKNHEPLWKFVLGFNHETSGRYSKADSEFVFQYNLGEERNKVEKEIIKNRISDWKSLPGLFLDKIKIMWSDSDALYWSLNTQENKRLSNILNLISHASYWVIMSFLLVSVFWLIFRYDNDERYLFFVVLILGYFSIHLLIEIQTRYRYFIMPSIILISGYSFSGLFSYILKKNSYFPRNLFNQIKKIAYKKKVETNL